MEELATRLLQIGLGLGFILSGVLILRSDDKWTRFWRPWARKLWPFPLQATMKVTAIYDIANGLWLLSGIGLWLAALFAAAHLLQVVVVSGPTDEATYRDMGLFFAALALAALAWPFN